MNRPQEVHMIHALHLLWICPLCAGVGLIVTALLVAGRDDE